MTLESNAYIRHYELARALNAEPGLISSPDLYNFDDQKLYNAIMDSVAQPWDGSESPFSSKAPGSAHSILIGDLIYLLKIYANQLNLMPDKAWVTIFRLLGASLKAEEFPVINLVFSRSREALLANQNLVIPAGTTAYYQYDKSLSATINQDYVISGADLSITVPATLNRILGATQLNFPIGSFNSINKSLPFLQAVVNDGTIVSAGSSAETLVQAMARLRETYRTGNRCVTPRDYRTFALQTGLAKKVNVVPGYQIGVFGSFPDLTTIAVYPGDSGVISAVSAAINDSSGRRIDIVPAEIVPINGSITVRKVAGLTDDQAFNLLAQAIVDEVNPPNGNWADRDLITTIGTAIERTNGIYAVESISLKRSTDNIPFEQLQPEVNWLYEIQSSLQVTYKN